MMSQSAAPTIYPTKATASVCYHISRQNNAFSYNIIWEYFNHQSLNFTAMSALYAEITYQIIWLDEELVES